MIRGTTPTHIYTLPIDTSLIKELVITYAQKEVPVIEKRASDCLFDGNQIKVVLSQEETFKFDEKNKVDIQLRILTLSNTALASKIKTIPVYDVLNEEVLK